MAFREVMSEAILVGRCVTPERLKPLRRRGTLRNWLDRARQTGFEECYGIQTVLNGLRLFCVRNEP